MHHVEANLFEQVERVLELFLAFAAEADDNIGGKRDAGPQRAQARDAVAILVKGIAALHAPQQFVVARLHGNIDMLAYFGQRGHAFDHTVVHVARVRGHEADALQPVDLAELRHQFGQVRLAGQIQPVSLDGLAQQRQFFRTFGDQRGGFRDQFVHRDGCARVPGDMARYNRCRPCYIPAQRAATRSGWSAPVQSS